MVKDCISRSTASRFAGSTLTIEVETAHVGRLTVEARTGDALTREGTPVCLAWPREKTILLRKQHRDG